MIKVASYCRVSTDKEDQANSFEAQQRYFQEYIVKNPDWELYDIYADEGISGTSIKKRTAFNRMIADAHAGKFQLILTKEISRFSRNIVDTLTYTRELKAIGVAVEFMTDHINTMKGSDEMCLAFLATTAQEESRKTSNRVVWGQTRQMEKGVVFGHSLLGYDVKGGKMTIEPGGAEIVRLIFQKYAVEQVGTSEIARFLTREGYRTYRGSSKWKSNSIIKILKNEKYVGDLVQKKTYTPDYLSHAKRSNKGQVPLIRIENHHEPIISREIWNLAQERMQKNNKHGDGSGVHSNRYVFSGKIKCGECGASFVGRMRALKDGTKVRRWSCGTAVIKGTDGCNIGKLIRDDDAMNMLKTAIRSLQIDNKFIVSNVTILALDAIQAGESGTTDAPERLQFEIDRVHQKREAVMDSYFSGDISKEDMLAMKKRYEDQEKSFRERLQKTEERLQQGCATGQLKEAIQGEIAALLRCETESEVLSKTLLDSLTVFKDRHMELRLNYLPQVFRFAG